MKRREFLKKSAITSAALSLGLSGFTLQMKRGEKLFDISLAQWSVNSLLFSGEMDNLDFPVLTKKHGINAVEYVNQFFMDKAEDINYLRELKNRCDSEGVRSILIMCDREGQLGASDSSERMQTVENHKKWVEAARFLGCHSIRVNAYTDIPWSDDPEIANETKKLVSDGMRQLCEFAAGFNINVLIENHGGYSSDPYWLADVIEITHHPNAGTLPDFGNFRIYSDDYRTVSFDSYNLPSR